MRTSNQPSIEITRITQNLKTSGWRTYCDELLGHATNAQKQNIAQMEFDVRRCLLACEFRTRSLLNNNCVNIRSHVARDYLVLQVHLLIVQLPWSYNILLFITSATTKLWRDSYFIVFQSKQKSIFSQENNV